MLRGTQARADRHHGMVEDRYGACKGEAHDTWRYSSWYQPHGRECSATTHDAQRKAWKRQANQVKRVSTSAWSSVEYGVCALTCSQDARKGGKVPGGTCANSVEGAHMTDGPNKEAGTLLVQAERL